jgi:hypothetical protein
MLPRHAFCVLSTGESATWLLIDSLRLFEKSDQLAGHWRYDSFFRYPGKGFDEVEESVAADYEKEKPGSALPWDTVRPAVNSVWERMAGVIGPRDPDRGIRGAI